MQAAFPQDEMEYFNWASASDTFPKFAKLLSLPTYTYFVQLGLTVSAGGLTESLVRLHKTLLCQRHSVKKLYQKLVQVVVYKKLARVLVSLVQVLSCKSFVHAIEHNSIPCLLYTSDAADE